jgi:hypothetical protein
VKAFCLSRPDLNALWLDHQIAKQYRIHLAFATEAYSVPKKISSQHNANIDIDNLS